MVSRALRTGEAHAYVARMEDVPGHLSSLDAELFVHLASAQAAAGLAGDFLEIGAWYGRSAILLGYLTEEGDAVHVCDLFEAPPPTEGGRRELAAGGVAVPSRSEFESWYRRYHADLPVIHPVPSSALVPAQLGGPARFRFLHVDGSHTYDAVRGDVGLVRRLATNGAVIAFDDYANPGHPSVAAALWPAVERGELQPFACTPSKFYAAVEGEQAARCREAVERLAVASGYRWNVSAVPGGDMIALWAPEPGRSLASRVARRARRTLRRLRSA